MYNNVYHKNTCVPFECHIDYFEQLDFLLKTKLPVSLHFVTCDYYH